MIRVAVCVDDVGDRQSLVAGALDERFGRVRRVDQHALSGVPVAEQVAEVPVAAGTDLFEDELHPGLTCARRAVTWVWAAPLSRKISPFVFLEESERKCV